MNKGDIYALISPRFPPADAARGVSLFSSYFTFLTVFITLGGT